MSSALGMNLMPPTSAFQHGLQQAAVQAAAAAAAASKQPQLTASSETNEDLEHVPTMTDSMTGNKSEHAAGKLALASSDPYDMEDSDSEQARRLSHEDDDLIDDHEAIRPDLDNDDSNNDSMLRPNQDSLLEDGTGSEYACSPVASSGGIGGILRVGHVGLGGLRGLHNNHDVIDEDDDTKDGQSSIMQHMALNNSEQNHNHSPINSNNSNNVSSASSRRNKRKNFKPRNIFHDQASESQQTLPMKKLNLMPQARDNNGPMDLSVQGTNGADVLDHDGNGLDDLEDEEDASSELPPMQESPMTSSAGLSLVRPEVLFGGQKEAMLNSLAMSGGMPAGVPPFLAPFLASANMSPSGPGGPSMKDAFQEVLKLFGFPPELAEVFAKNAQALQQHQHKDPSSNGPAGQLAAAAAAAAAASAAMSQQQQQLQLQQAGGGHQDHHPESKPLGEEAKRSSGSPLPSSTGMLSAALLGNNSSTLHNNIANSHPPTPPRTPQNPKMTPAALAAAVGDLKPPLAHNHGSPSSAGGHAPGGGPPQMPPLLSLAAIQDQVKGPNILAAQLSKPMMLPGMTLGSPGGPGGPGMPPMPKFGGLHSQIPPHILAAQRAGVLPGSTKSPTDYTRYFRRFSSSLECGSYYCKDMNYREHFHCTVPMCKSKVFAKKEEMIRHSKWHQKMDEAYKYGFRRVTPTDDCADQFPGCQHNKKQTHYHCIQSGHCDKVYISTSDVQMHFNYHRKDNAIQREGFLRFRGCEDCASPQCPFRGQKTTHFHCNRSTCQFTFKNKADMEKHKNFHMKDEQLNKDGFKKFMKQDPCGFDNCRFSKTVNHIHCIRSSCDYVLHSSGQLFAHKRKHERRDNELAYRKYKLTQSMLASLGPNATDEQKEQVAKIAEAAAHTMNGSDMTIENRPASPGSMNSESSTTPPLQLPPSMQPQPHFQPPPPPPNANALSMLPHLRPQLPPGMLPLGFQPPQIPLPASGLFGVPGSLPGPSQLLPQQQHQQTPMLLSEVVRERVPEDAWQTYMLHFDSGEGCGFQGCEIEDLSHYHCKDDGCEMVFRHEDGVRDHGRNHFIQDQISDLFFVGGDPEDEPDGPECPDSCPHRKVGTHYHCKWESCSEVIFSNDTPFKRLDHYKLHEYTRKWNFSSANNEPVTMTLTNSIDAMFKRKRGRPPKNRVIEVWNDNYGREIGQQGDLHGSPQAVFTSFKLPKPGQGVGGGPGGINSGSPFGPGGDHPMLRSSPGPVSPITSQSAGFGSRLFPLGLGNLPTPPGSNNPLQSSPPKVNAPLGGLPALADQILMQQAIQLKDRDDLEAESNNNRLGVSPSRSPLPTSPPPSKMRGPGGLEAGDSSGSEGTPLKNQGGQIRPKGTYYPLTAFPTSMPQGPVMRCESPPKEEIPASSGDEVSPTISLKSKLGVNFMVSFSRSNETENPLAKLLQASQDMVSGQTTTTTASGGSSPAHGGAGGSGVGSITAANVGEQLPLILSLASHAQYGPEPEEESCGRPFCKLKRRLHFHCNICNQGFTEKDKLDSHLKRHASPQEMTHNLAAMLKEPLPQEEIARSSPLSLVMSNPGNMVTTTTPAMTSTVTTNSCSNRSSPASSPGKSSPPLAPSGPLSSNPGTPPMVLPPVSMPPINAIPGLPPGFPAGMPPHFGLMQGLRHPLSGLTPTSGSQSLLSPNPFLPPGMMIPGMPFPGLPAGFPGLQNGPPVSLVSTTASPTAALQTLSSRMAPDQFPGLKRSSPSMSDILADDSMNMEQKKMRLQSSMRMLKDEPVPEGYMRFRFNEDCGFTCCNYREHQTHFHCMRKDCNYRFCDKTRFVQHTARHERLDTLCGEEFEGFRGVTCGRPTCELNSLHARIPVAGDAQKSSSHFHCLKCDYYCTDTNKVVAHRRQHQKLDSIMAAGFEKYTPTQFCPVGGCPHNGKQTHYHCAKCQYAVLGLSQMEGHKYRHMNE